MKLRTMIFRMTLALMMITGVVVSVQTVAHGEVTWKHYSPKMLGEANKWKMLKFSSSGWAYYDTDYQKHELKANKYTQYTYKRSTRTMLIRYKNKNRALPVKYNYMRIKLSHGYRNPIFNYHYKIGKDRWAYLYTVKFWLVKPIRY